MPQNNAAFSQPTNAERLLYWSLIFIVALAPLPLGSNRPLPIALFSALTGSLLLIWAAMNVADRLGPSRQSGDIKYAAIAFGLVCLWIAFQALPVGQWGDPTWRSASQALAAPLEGHYSVNPAATLEGLMHLVTYAGIFWLSLKLNSAPDRASTSIKAVIWVGTIYALYGLISFFSGDEWLLFYRKWTYQGSLTSTFVNRNSYATFAGLCLLCGSVLLVERLRPALEMRLPFRSKLVVLLEELFARSIWITISVIIMALALLLSASRAGTASTLLGLLFLLLVFIGSRKVFSIASLSAIAATLITATILVSAGGNHLSSRLTPDDIDSSFGVRGQVYLQVIQAIKTTPWTGTGFGTFEEAFPAYRTPEKPDLILWDKAHNTYLENALDLGLPAALLLNLSILLAALEAARGIARRKRGKLMPALGVAATILVGAHSLVDFSLQIPAVSMLYAFILGLAVSQSRSLRAEPRRTMASPLPA